MWKRKLEAKFLWKRKHFEERSWKRTRKHLTFWEPEAKAFFIKYGAGMWKRKRLNFCESGSILKKKLEAEANSAATNFMRSWKRKQNIFYCFHIPGWWQTMHVTSRLLLSCCCRTNHGYEWIRKKVYAESLGLDTHLFVKVPRLGDSEGNFSDLGVKLPLVTTSLTTQR